MLKYKLMDFTLFESKIKNLTILLIIIIWIDTIRVNNNKNAG